MQVWSGPARILAAGSATTFGGHPLLLTLDVDGDSLVIELRFGSDVRHVGPSVQTEPTGTGYRLNCVNFDDPGGRGSAEPILLGELADDLVFMHFHATRFGRSIDMVVQFTFYRVPKAEIGWRPTVATG